MAATRRPVVVKESGEGPYGQLGVVGPHTFTADEPESLGGHFTGPDPYELLLGALGACTNMTLRMYAARKELPLRRISTTLTHHTEDVEGSVRDVFTRTLLLEGELDDAQRQRLVEIADKCPVSRTLERGSVLRTRLG